MIFIGIDPGAQEKNIGFAAYDSVKNQLVEVKSISFFQCISDLKNYKMTFPDVHVRIEAPEENKPVWAGMMKQQILKVLYSSQPTRTKVPLVISCLNRFGKIAQNVGANKQTGILIQRFMDDNNIKYTRCKPTKKSITKINAETFKKITGYNKKTNEHSRDAGMLVFGLSSLVV